MRSGVFNIKKRKMKVLKNSLAVMAALWLLMAASCGNAEKWERHITEETLSVEGLEGEYTLLFLTDTHVVIPDPEADEGQTEYEVSRQALFVGEEGVTSAEQFSGWIQYANELQVDAVLLGGDIIDTPSETNLEWLEQQLSQLTMPYLYIPGNHDWTYPWDYMTEQGRETYLPLLEPFMQGNTAVQTLELGEFTVVGINDSTNQVEGTVLFEYEALLAEGKPLIVMTHVPFYTQSLVEKATEIWSSPVVIGGGIYPNENSGRFIALTTGAGSPVELVLAGHVHFYDRAIIEGEQDVLQIVGDAGYMGNAILLHVQGE